MCEVSEARSGGEGQRCTKNKNLCFVPFRTTEWGIRGPHKMPGKTLDSKHKPTAVAERLRSSHVAPLFGLECAEAFVRQPFVRQPFVPSADRPTALPPACTLHSANCLSQTTDAVKPFSIIILKRG